MTSPEPFPYPADVVPRCHGPSPYKEYQQFKPWLRDEFTFRCVYCLFREMWYPSRSHAFSVDHIIPRSVAPSLACDYFNLAYACNRCNSFRQDVDLGDPLSDPLGRHLAVRPDGTVTGLTSRGRKIIDKLLLNHPAAVALRRQVLHILELLEEFPGDPRVRQLYLHFFGFPDDLPDLARLARRGKRSGPAWRDSSYFCMRRLGTLPETY